MNKVRSTWFWEFGRMVFRRQPAENEPFITLRAWSYIWTLFAIAAGFAVADYAFSGFWQGLLGFLTAIFAWRMGKNLLRYFQDTDSENTVFHPVNLLVLFWGDVFAWVFMQIPLAIVIFWNIVKVLYALGTYIEGFFPLFGG